MRDSRLTRDFARRDALVAPRGTDVVVAKGDTLAGIARRHGSTPETIARANAMKVHDPIYEGQFLFVPQTGGAPPPPSR